MPQSPQHLEAKRLKSVLSASARFIALTGLAMCLSVPAMAATYPVAVFGGLDKITARVSKFSATVDQPTRFGALELTVRACDMRPPEETPQTAAYVEIRQINESNNTIDPTPIFKGWIFAESPGLNGLEHPVYDVWLKTCKSSDAS
tara:strand:- start:135236 stop:135673 length:438 start_codon:yes stop_codon:yes gene_type:complete